MVHNFDGINEFYLAKCQKVLKINAHLRNSRHIIFPNVLSIWNIFTIIKCWIIFSWQVACVYVYVCVHTLLLYSMMCVMVAYLLSVLWTNMLVCMHAWLTGFFVCFAMLRIMVSFFFFAFCISLTQQPRLKFLHKLKRTHGTRRRRIK